MKMEVSYVLRCEVAPRVLQKRRVAHVQCLVPVVCKGDGASIMIVGRFAQRAPARIANDTRDVHVDELG